MNIIRVIMPIFLSIVEMVLDTLSGKVDYQQFQQQLANKLNEVGCEIMKLVLQELDEEIKQDKSKRPGWQVCRTGDPKEIVTCFGVISYERTYYRHKTTRQYAYLVDEQAGYTPHMRVGQEVKAKLVSCAADMAYRKSARAVGDACGGITLSGQTVLQAVRQFGRPVKSVQERKKVKTLYIEADEDHVANQHGRAMEARLVYVHEGWHDQNGHREIVNPLYQSSVDEDAYEFWERIWDEVNARYDLDSVEKIYLMGDGAAWIQCGLNVFPEAEFILDRFHLMKYIRRAVGGLHKQGKALRGALRFGNREKAEKVIEELVNLASTKGRKQAILEAWGYIENNWEGITGLYRQRDVWCSAEGHVSHVLSARLSSRPMGWSLDGARHMAYVRVCQANGQSVAAEYIRQQQTKELPVLTVAEERLETERKKLREAREVLDNIPVLKGPKSFLYEALRGLSLAFACS